MEQLISQSQAAMEGGKVVFIQEFMGDRKSGIQEWLYHEVCREFGTDSVEDIVENPLLRLSLKYDGLDDKEQERMFRYTEEVIAERRGRRIGRKNILSELLNMGNYETWEMIEEFTDRLLSGSGIGRTGACMTGKNGTQSVEGGAF